MKPLNLDNRPCSPISSNCVIWQGPDIPCIKLCSGDTISDVVFKLATELCTIMDQLNVSNYDLSCFDLAACPPEDFQALIKFLITKICELNGIPSEDPKSSGCPDCPVAVATCLIENGQTTMQLIDYVQLIATKLCALIAEIESINEQISVINFTLTDLQFQIDNLPVYELPSFEVDCILSGSQPLDVVVQTLMNDPASGYCSLLGSTGQPADINTAVLTQCITDTDQPLAALALSPPVISTFSAYYSGSWVNAVDLGASPTLANAVNNIWIAICDMYTYLSNLTQSTTVVDAGEGITVTSATVGTTTTYTVTNDYLESFTATVVINDAYTPVSGIIPSVVPSTVDGVQDGQVILRYTSVRSNDQLVIASTSVDFVPNADLPPITFGSFDNITGLFTITDPGTYLINATIHLKATEGSSEFWSNPTTSPPTTPSLGSFLIGIHPNNSTDTYVADGQALIPDIDKNVEISTSKVISATNPTNLRVKVLNTTNRDYNGHTYDGADGISFSITKLRSGLTITNL